MVFEVATIKPAPQFDFKNMGVHVVATRVSYTTMSLQSLFTYAYDVNYFRISGPDWIGKDLYNIVARAPEGASPGSEREMLQALLADRFQLRFHVETREVKALALVRGKDGVKMQLASPSAAEDTSPLRPGERFVGQGRERHRERVIFDDDAHIVHTETDLITMKDLARVLTSILRDAGGKDVVVDRTGLEGSYQGRLDFPIATKGLSGDATEAFAADPAGRGVLMKSLDKLGLKLVKQEISVEFYVIDHVAQPSEN